MNDQPHDPSADDAPLPRPGHDEPTVPAASVPEETVPVESIPVDEPTATHSTVAPVATTVTTRTEPARRNGVLVPAWSLFTIGGLLLLLIGGLVGFAIGDHHGDGRDDRAVGFVRPGRLAPGQGNFAPFGGRDGNNRNGNGGNGNGSRNGAPSTPATPSGSGAFLGVAVQNSTNPAGAELVRVVAGSPAAKAGLTTGDVVTAVDGQKVAGAAAMTSRIRSHSPGDKVTLTYLRDGQSKTVTVTLGDRNATSTQ